MLKIVVRVVFWIAVLNYFDALTRTNVANAKDDMLAELHIADKEYSTIVSIFYATYMICQVPAAALYGHVKPSLRFGVSCILVGIVGCIPGFVTQFWQLALSRALLAITQGGNFTGICGAIANWYGENDRSSAMAYVGFASSAAQISSGFIAYGVLQIKNYLGLPGWRWLFIVEGVPAIIFGILIIWLLPDSYKNKKWLSDEEKNKLKELAILNSAKEVGDHSIKYKFSQLRFIVKNWRLWMLGMALMCNAAATTFYMYYAPSIISSLGIPFYKSNLITVPLQVANSIMGILYSKFCAYFAKGNWQICTIAVSCFSAISIVLLGFSISIHQTILTWVGLICLNAVQGVYFNPMYTWITMETQEEGSLASLSVAFIFCLGNIGSLLGPQISSLASVIGKSSGYGMAIMMAGSLQAMGTILFVILHLLRRSEYARMRDIKKPSTISINVDSDENSKLIHNSGQNEEKEIQKEEAEFN